MQTPLLVKPAGAFLPKHQQCSYVRPVGKAASLRLHLGCSWQGAFDSFRVEQTAALGPTRAKPPLKDPILSRKEQFKTIPRFKGKGQLQRKGTSRSIFYLWLLIAVIIDLGGVGRRRASPIAAKLTAALSSRCFPDLIRIADNYIKYVHQRIGSCSHLEE
jgi:hypothetical protein